MALEPAYWTLAHQVPLKAGQAVHFTPGKGYYAAPKPPQTIQIAQNPSPTPPASAPAVSPFLTPAQMGAQARLQAQQNIDAQAAPIRLAMQDAARSALGQEQATVGFTGAAQNELSQLKPQIEQAYADAAAGLAHAPGAGQPYADIAREQVGKEGAAASSWGGLIGSIQGDRGQDDVAALIGKAADDQRAYEDKLTALAATYPQLRDQALAEINKSQLDLKQFALQVQAQRDVEQKLGIQSKDTQSLINLRDAEVLKTKTAANAPNAALSKVYGYVVDSSGNAIPGKDGNVVPVAQSAKGSGGKQSALQKANSLGTSIARSNSSQVAGLDNPATPQDESKTTKTYKVTYHQTLAEIEASITPILAPQGFSTSEIIRTATRLANGYYAPGEGGRPATTAAKRAARASRTRK